MPLYLIAALLFAIAVALFAVQNSTPVNINFFVYQFEQVSLVIVILISVLFGALIVFLLSMVKQVSLLRRIHALEKRQELWEAGRDKTINKEEKPGEQASEPETN